MSKGSTPIHTSSTYNMFYDPDYTAEISAKMNVPVTISYGEGLHNTAPNSIQRDELRDMMKVPERILYGGENTHIAVRDYVPELKFERSFPTNMPNYVLQPPPNTLTVDEYPYPSVEFNKPTAKEVKTRPSVEPPTTLLDLNESSVSSIAPEDETVLMKKQLRHLSKRVIALEQDNQQRQQREIILYTVGITYFVLKGLIWLHRHF